MGGLAMWLIILREDLVGYNGFCWWKTEVIHCPFLQSFALVRCFVYPPLLGSDNLCALSLSICI